MLRSISCYVKFSILRVCFQKLAAKAFSEHWHIDCYQLASNCLLSLAFQFDTNIIQIHSSCSIWFAKTISNNQNAIERTNFNKMIMYYQHRSCKTIKYLTISYQIAVVQIKYWLPTLNRLFDGLFSCSRQASLKSLPYSRFSRTTSIKALISICSMLYTTWEFLFPHQIRSIIRLDHGKLHSSKKSNIPVEKDSSLSLPAEESFSII